MAALSLDNGILYMRELLQDSNANFPGATDAEYTRVVNKWYAWLYKNLIRRSPTVATAVTTISTSNPYNTSDAGFVYPEVEAAYIDHQTGPDTPLDRYDWATLEEIIQYTIDSTGVEFSEAGIPWAYAAQRLHGSAEKWQFLLYPLCNVVATLKCRVRVMPTALSGTNVPELDDAQGYLLYDLAAADMAPIVGRPELTEGILRSVPDNIRGMLQVERKRDDPKRRIEAGLLG